MIIPFLCGRAQKTFVFISGKNGKINTTVIKDLPPKLKGMAACFSAMGGTNCKDLECALTSALRLGKQGSDEQKN